MQHHTPTTPNDTTRRSVQETAARLAELFAHDSNIVQRLNEAQARLEEANLGSWTGIHHDALALLHADTRTAGIRADGGNRSEIVAVLIDYLNAVADQRAVEAAVLAVAQEVHWTIQRALVDLQGAWEERRQLAADVGELTRHLINTLAAAGYTEQQARSANVHQLAEGVATVDRPKTTQGARRWPR